MPFDLIKRDAKKLYIQGGFFSNLELVPYSYWVLRPNEIRRTSEKMSCRLLGNARWSCHHGDGPGRVSALRLGSRNRILLRTHK